MRVGVGNNDAVRIVITSDLNGTSVLDTTLEPTNI